MTTREVLKELESYSSESIKKVFLKHGAREPFYGVKVEDLKKIQKKNLYCSVSIKMFSNHRKTLRLIFV